MPINDGYVVQISWKFQMFTKSFRFSNRIAEQVILKVNYLEKLIKVNDRRHTAVETQTLCQMRLATK